MKTYSLIERAGFYNKAFAKWPESHLHANERWLDGMWIMGQNFRTSGLYGAYPHGYLVRVTEIFPDAERILHLFSGSLPHSPHYTRFDRLLERSDISGDAEHLSAHCVGRTFDIIYADPPYSVEDCEHYGCAMINRNKVLAECVKVLEPGGFIVWLDQVLPMFRKVDIHMVGVIGMVKSTNHRFRVVTIFQKPPQPPADGRKQMG